MRLYSLLIILICSIISVSAQSHKLLKLNDSLIDTVQNLKSSTKDGEDLTCTGSLGDSIENETFGSGASPFGNLLPDGITNLQYVSNSCPTDGDYTITNHTFGCYDGEWNDVHDHTGDANGYFMKIVSW